MWWRPEHAAANGARIDGGIVEGDTISPFYDPMVAKIIVHGRDRNDAIRRLRAALANAPLLGLRNNGRFLSDLVDSPAFRDASMTTALIDQWQAQNAPLLMRPVPDDAVWRLAASIFALQQGANWRPNSVAAFDVSLRCDELTRVLRVRPDRAGRVLVTLEKQDSLVAIAALPASCTGELRFDIDQVTRKAVMVMTPTALHLALNEAQFVFHELSAFPDANQAQDAKRACAPVAGKVSQVQVAVGDTVMDGQAMVCVEAMKMEMWVPAQASGRVTAVHVRLGEQVESGALLVELEIAAPSEGVGA